MLSTTKASSEKLRTVIIARNNELEPESSLPEANLEGKRVEDLNFDSFIATDDDYNEESNEIRR